MNRLVGKLVITLLMGAAAEMGRRIVQGMTAQWPEKPIQEMKMNRPKKMTLQIAKSGQR